MPEPRHLDIVRNDAHSLRVTWVDDAFDNPELRAEHPSALLRFETIEKYLAGVKPNIVVPDFKLLLIAEGICKKLGVSFRIANFEYLENLCDEGDLPSNEVLLIDLNYTGKSNAETYGAELAVSRKIPQHQFRCFSVIRDALGDFVIKYGHALPAPMIKQPLAFEQEFQKWLASLLLHDDPFVNQALLFYSQPWTEVWGWGWHDGSEEHHDDTNKEQRRRLAIWLGFPLDKISDKRGLESSKNLLEWYGEAKGWWWPDFYLVDEPQTLQRPGYQLNGSVLLKLMERLGLCVVGVDERAMYRTPLIPSLPFFLALRAFAAKVNQKPKVIWSRFRRDGDSDAYLLTIETDQEHQDWGLRNRYFKPEGRGRGKVDPLKNLMHSIVLKKNPGARYVARDEWKGLFTEGVEFPPCGVSFTPGAVHLSWTTRKEDEV